MKRLTKPLLALGLLAVFGGGGFYAWKKAHPPLDTKEKRFEDMDPEKYEQWMQDLGYTE